MIEIDKFIYCILKFSKLQNFNIKSFDDYTIDNLRKFHNFIKSNLIIESCKNIDAKSLLDIACGRGGDIQKWINNKISLKYIVAFDNHKESIYSSIKKGDQFDGAIARFLNVKRNFRGKLPYINFQHGNILDINILDKLNKIDSNKIYDIVSCQFALHYFAKDEKSLDHVLSVVSSKLRSGGLFIGTATDGDLIYNILKNGNVNIPLLKLIKKNNDNYLFYIDVEKKVENINRQNYFELQGISSEFYLFKERLEKIALKNNLKLIQYKSFYDWYQIYKKINSFQELNIYELVVSFLNFSFVFQKN